MKFDKVQFVYIDIDYLKELNKIESEIFYDANNCIRHVKICIFQIFHFRGLKKIYNSVIFFSYYERIQ